MKQTVAEKPMKVNEEISHGAHRGHRDFIMNENDIADIIIECAIKIHKEIGPGLLESVYEKILVYELAKRGLKVEQQKMIGIKYDNVVFEQGFRADLIVDNKVIVEIKSIKEFEQIHFKQLLTYLRLSHKKLGLLLNFNKELMKQGIKRIINGTIINGSQCAQ